MNYKITKRRHTNIDILDIETADAYLTVSLFGGQVLGFTPKSDNRQRLWLSENAVLDGSKPIRGGIPICWPWFGAHPKQSELPAHGYVRNQNWSMQPPAFTSKGLLIKLIPGNAALMQTGLALELQIILGQQLEIQLITSNTGNSEQNISMAMHNYFAVEDIHTTWLEGLETSYLDKLDNNQLKLAPSPYQLNQATDRIHLTSADKVKIHSTSYNTGLVASGHDSFVVWNPWQQKVQQMPDMGIGSHLGMLCVESAHTQGLSLAPGQRHKLTQTIV